MTLQGIDPAHSLADECQTARQLLAVLQREQAQLIDADIVALPAQVDEKSQLIGQMSTLANQRHKKLASIGHESSEHGMKAWLKSAPANANQSWKQLLELAQAAKEINRINGMLIARHLSRNQIALHALNLHSGGGNFYGPDGQSMTKPGSRNFVIG